TATGAPYVGGDRNRIAARATHDRLTCSADGLLADHVARAAPRTGDREDERGSGPGLATARTLARVRGERTPVGCVALRQPLVDVWYQPVAHGAEEFGVIAEGTSLARAAAGDTHPILLHRMSDGRYDNARVSSEARRADRMHRLAPTSMRQC